MKSTPHKVVREKRKKLVEVSTLCPEKIYVELRVPSEAYSVHQIVFRTTSHDQGNEVSCPTQATKLTVLGFSGDPRYHGTYEHSFTWFFAAVVTPGGQERVSRKVLHHNVHADSRFKNHEICWGGDDQDQSTSEWINAIQGGDTIQIIPVAQYPAWINYVKKAEIELHYILVPKDASILSTPRPVVVSSLTDYQLYRSLDTKISEIRLIHLHPGACEDPIICSMTYMSLSACDQSYEALSYCWGDPRKREDIKITAADLAGPGFTMSVSLSLHSALKKLRPRNGPLRILWVDAICINQEDFDERSSQVSLMRDIYRKAQGVVIWLGDGTELVHKAIATLNDIKSRNEVEKPSNLPTAELSRLHHPLMETAPGENHQLMYDFNENWTLFESLWFSRTWVVQEAFNARETNFCCGDQTLDLETILRVNKCISLLEGLNISSHKTTLPAIYDDLFHARFATSSKAMRNGILEILIKGLDLDATDPRDKIFAMLQFGKETQDLGSLPRELVPDYRKSAAEVFSAFTKWWIVEHKSLRILSAIHALDGRAWQPNKWDTAPKYDADQPTWSWWYRGKSNWAIGILGLKTENPYRASGYTNPDISLITGAKELSILSLAGIKIDCIKTLGPYSYFDPPEDLEGLHRAYIGIYDPLNHTGKWQRQLAPEVLDTYVFSDDVQKIEAHYYAHLEFSSETNAVECIDPCFFSTGGGLRGLCPPSARVGDIVVVLYGGPVPYVLRELPEVDHGAQRGARRYEFIGECYLESYMDGQGIKDHEQGKYPTEAFSLV